MQLKEKVIKGKQKDIFIVWPDKSKFALEVYIFSRFYMYQSVYFHHTTRGFEGLLKKILQCAFLILFILPKIREQSPCLSVFPKKIREKKG